MPELVFHSAEMGCEPYCAACLAYSPATSFVCNGKRM
jgi:hypothetical protein